MARDPRGPIESGLLVATPRMAPVTNYPPPLDAGVLDAGALNDGVLSAPLGVAVEPLTGAEQHWIARVACLGGTIDQTAVELFKHRYGRPPLDPERRARGYERFADPREFALRAELDDIDALDHLRRMIGYEFGVYDAMVYREFDGLSPLVRDHFKPRPDAGEDETREHYFNLRPIYCAVGIEDPKGMVFDKLVPAKLLNRTVVVHQELANQLALLSDTLDAGTPGTSDAMAQAVTSAGGFAPRVVANTQILSNHGLGLALDVNATNNPHIVKGQHIVLIKDITRTPAFPEGFDFGQLLVKPADQQLVGEPERQQKIKEITEIHTRSQTASDSLRDWLQKALEKEAEAKYNLSQLAQVVNEWRARIVNAADLGEAESYRAAYEHAELTLTSETAKFNSDGDIQRLNALRQVVSEDTIRLWAREGIRNLPLDLVIALVVDLRLTWGEEWADSKDGMHFDYLKRADGGVIAPRKGVMSLDAVLDSGPHGM